MGIRLCYYIRALGHFYLIMSATKASTIDIESLSRAGVHYGRQKGRRHPTAKRFIFGAKGQFEIFDLEGTVAELARALEAARAVGERGGQILMISGKTEARGAIKDAASSAGLPYVAGRYIGGTLTNFGEIKKRIARMENLIDQKEKGELAKYTKKERLLIDREIETLKEKFGGISNMKTLPAMLYVVDPRKECIAVREANELGIPVMALASSDCNMTELAYPIPGNDALESSVRLITDKIALSYKEGRKMSKVE